MKIVPAALFILIIVLAGCHPVVTATPTAKSPDPTPTDTPIPSATPEPASTPTPPPVPSILDGYSHVFAYSDDTKIIFTDTTGNSITSTENKSGKMGDFKVSPDNRSII